MGWGFEEPMDGAKGSNQAIAAARLGTRVTFVGCLGRDRYGVEGEGWLQEAGVDTRFVTYSPDKSSLGGFVLLDEQGVPAIVGLMGANGDLTREAVDRALAQTADARVLLTQFEIRTEVALHAARRARESGKRVILNPAPAPEHPLPGLDAVHYLTPNETEAKTLLGLDPGRPADPVKMALNLREKSGAACVMITVGERGVVAADETGTWRTPAPQVPTVTDTTGAGDAFNAALAVGLARGEEPRAAAARACQVAAYTVTRRGTIPVFPTPSEVDRFLQEIGA